MNPRRALTLLGLVSAATALQGCIAVAAPFVAGAALASRVGKDRKPELAGPARAGSVEVFDPSPAQGATPDDFPAVFAAFNGSELPPASGVVPATGVAVGDERVTFFSNAEAPAPGGTVATLADPPVYAAFRTYSLNLAQANRSMGGLPSALLATPGSLSPERASCAKDAPAVLVDLDPGRGTFDPSQSVGGGTAASWGGGIADPALAATLAELRAANIGVIWMTRLGENFEELVRAALRDHGLDSAGADRLVMMRTIDERKQTRRDTLGTQNCILAILGDERADFDELYLYLKDPATASALERIVGSGWFLTQATP